MLTGTGLAHQFRLFRIRDARALDAAPQSPDIVLVFVHGHHGGADQGNTIAYATASAYARDQKWAETYAVDFNSGSSAFDGAIAHVQVGFLRQALLFVEDLHAGVEVVVIAHSMGGVVARAALAPTFADHHTSITTLITINSPLQMHPLLTDPKFTSLYEIAIDRLGLAVVSIVGGHRDTLVPSTSGVLKRHAHLLTLFTASMPGVWTDLGHDDALACTELWSPLLSSIMAAANSTDVSSRIDTYRRRLQISIGDIDERRDDAPDQLPLIQVVEDHVYRVLRPAAVLSTSPCSELSTSPSADILEMPLPYEWDHDRAKLRDFAAPVETGASPLAWACMVTTNDPVNITSMHTLAFGALHHIDMDIRVLSSTTTAVPIGTSTVILSFSVQEPWPAALWNGLVPAVLSLTVRRTSDPPASSTGTTTTTATTSSSQQHVEQGPIPELLVVQSNDPASGETRWYRNPNPISSEWRTTIAFHPGPSRSLRGRLALTPDHHYELQLGIDLITTLGAGLRLADKSSLISPFVSIIYYHIAGLPHPNLASIVALPCLSWASSKFAYDDDWSAPRFGLVLNVVLFWIGLSVFTLVTGVARVLRRLLSRSPIGVSFHQIVVAHPNQFMFLALIMTSCFGPWSCMVALWFLVGAKWIRTPPSPFRAFVFCAYFTVLGLKATLIFSVWHQLTNTTSASWVSFLTDSGPGLGAFFGHEMLLAVPIGLHLILMLIYQGAHDQVDLGAQWLRMTAGFTCFVTLSAHYRLFEFIFATSLFAFCCCLENLRFCLRKSKGSPI